MRKYIITMMLSFSIISLVGCNNKIDKKEETTVINSTEKETLGKEEMKNYEIEVEVVSVDLNNNLFVGSHEQYFDTKTESYLTSVEDSVYGIPDNYTDVINVGDKLKLKYSYISNSKEPNIQFLGMEKIN